MTGTEQSPRGASAAAAPRNESVDERAALVPGRRPLPGACAISVPALGLDQVVGEVGVDLPHQMDAREWPLGCQSSSAGSRLSAPKSAASAPMAARMIANAAT